MEIFTKVQKLWDEWDIRVMVLFSLLLQIIHIISGNKIKRITGTWIRILIWLPYLLADLMATVSLGTLSRSSLDPDYTLMAFWAPFLLPHLGGPDSSTAYSLEDKELWWRHLLGLIIQVGVAFYVFVRYWTGTGLTLLFIPMFIAGIIKYGERTRVLRSASSKQFRDSFLRAPDPGPDYAKFMEDYSSRKREDVGFQVAIKCPLPPPTVGDDITIYS